MGDGAKQVVDQCNHSASAGGSSGSEIPEFVQLLPKLALRVKVTVSATICVQPVVVDAPPAYSTWPVGA
jgi:hypothetical protein